MGIGRCRLHWRCVRYRVSSVADEGVILEQVAVRIGPVISRIVAVAAAALLFMGCVSTGDCPQSGSCVGPKPETLFYVESVAVEPWSATAPGGSAGDKLTQARSDLAGRGLMVVDIEHVVISGSSNCNDPGCPNGYALRITIRPSDDGLAVARCFVSRVDAASPPAAQRTDCAPLYKKS
jgi:hypothetical protein